MQKTISLTDENISNLAHQHYENFPVASLFLKKNLRKDVAYIYAFARIADDIADEGSYDEKHRLKTLQAMSAAIASNKLPEQKELKPLFEHIFRIIQQYSLNKELFRDLIKAFIQDINTKSYATYIDVLSYCKLSANPIGRIILRLNEQDTAANCAYSDAICSALQLINFLQDIHADYIQRCRIYIPQSDMQEAGVYIDDIFAERYQTKTNSLFKQQYQRCYKLLNDGNKLVKHLHGSIKFQIIVIISCAYTVLYLLQRRKTRIKIKPQLKLLHVPIILFYALRCYLKSFLK